MELRNSRVRAAALQLEAAVRCIAACVQEAEGPRLGELLILIREAGVDPLEAAFATGVRRFDRSGEYAADGALSAPRQLAFPFQPGSDAQRAVGSVFAGPVKAAHPGGERCF